MKYHAMYLLPLAIASAPIALAVTQVPRIRQFLRLSRVFSSNLTCFFGVAAVLLGAAQAWNYRYIISTDDPVSYLDIADAYLRGDWQAALNAHWSPLYSWILALALLIVKPDSYWELPLIKVVNFTIYMAAFAAFTFFLKELIKHHGRQIVRDPHGSLPVPEWVWTVSGYLLFLWSSLNWTPVYSDTPDMATAAFVYIAAGLLLRIQSHGAGWFNCILLGGTLGLAYLSKSPLLPLSLFFLTPVLFSTGGWRHLLPRVAVAVVCLAVIAGAFIAALSMHKGRFTFGDAGKYVYVTFVNPGFPTVPLTHWQGMPPEFGTPTHPTRQISDSPPAFEFAKPLPGTYAPWYEPSYWYDGLRIQFNPKQALRIFAKNLIFCWTNFLAMLVFGYVLLAYAGARPSASVAALKGNFSLVVPAVAAIGLYCVVTDLPRSHLENQPAMRYLAPFVVLLFAGIFSSIRLPDTAEARRWLSAVTAAVALVIGIGLVQAPIKEEAFRRVSNDHASWNIAQRLAAAAVTKGDEIARLGSEYPYWARLAGVRIVAEIPSDTKFWSQSAAARTTTLEAVRRTGAKLVVAAYANDKPSTAITEGWEQLDGTLYIYRFERQSLR